MIRDVVILTLNDLATAIQNKTLFLVLFVPLFVFVTLQLIDASEQDSAQLEIGLLEQGSYPPMMVQSLQSADAAFVISWHPDAAAARQWLREKRGDGILLPRETTSESCVLVVPTQASGQSAAIVESVLALQRALEGGSTPWIAQIRPLQHRALQLQMLPTWILMLALMVGFIILPAQVAEEKEKKLLLGLLQTPIHEIDWLLAKVVLGILLIVIAAFFLHLLTTFAFGALAGANYMVFLLAGGFCFSACGILVGFLCRTQASARTLGLLFYLPLLLPSALADFSKPLGSMAPWVPSYQFYRPIKSILLEGGRVADFPWYFLALLSVGTLTTFLSFQLMKRRWLM